MSGYRFDAVKYGESSAHQKEWGNRLIDELDLRGDERILDLGCGEGTLTARLASLVPQGGVVGMDSSASMIAAAKRLETDRLKFLLRDIDDLDLREGFDIVFSNAALHWVRDHDRLLINVHRALRSGGIARFNFAGDGNCSNFFAVVQEKMALPEFSKYFEGFQWPWYMPTVDEYRRKVESTGLFRSQVWGEVADRRFTEQEMSDWIDQPSIVPLLERVGAERKKDFRDAVVSAMLARTRGDDGRCFETFRRINLLARKI